MIYATRALCLCLCCAALSGCFSLEDKKPLSASAPNLALAKSTADQKKESLKNKQKSLSSLPDTLGGAVSSDRWIVYKDQEEEVFEGNVSYDNGTYIFRADYALSQRKQHLFTASGSVYIRKNEPDGSAYQLHADKVVYNYQTGQGYAQADSGKKIKLIYQNAPGDLLTALARRTDFDTKQETFYLSGEVFVTHANPQGQTSTLQADKISVRQKDQYALLQGNAEVKNDNYHVKSQTLEYNGTAQKSYAYGGRPLAQGQTEDGTFAIIADKVTAENDTRKIRLEGNVQGWTISEQINRSKANKSF